MYGSGVPNEKYVYEALIEAAGDGLQIIDADFKIISQNQIMQDFIGEYMGEYCYKAVCGEDSLCMECPTADAFADGSVHSREKTIRLGDKEINVEITASPIKDKSGKVQSIIEVFKNITERKNAETAIRKQQVMLEKRLFYEGALNRIAEAIAAHDNTRVILESMTAIIGETLQIDRCLIYEISLVKQQAIGLYGWLNPEGQGVAPVLSVIDLAKFPGRETFMKEQTWMQSHEDEINPMLLRDQSAGIFHGALGIKSLLWYPFAFSESGFYLLAINQVSYRRIWGKEVLEFLGVAGKQVELAIQKICLLEEQLRAEQAFWEE